MGMLNSPLTVAKALLMRQEGLRLKSYKDTMGKSTIGYGRCLDTEGITEAEAQHLLANDIVNFYKALQKQFAWYYMLDDVRQLALLSMVYNLGMDGLLRFKRMLIALEGKKWNIAAIEALDSEWHTQVGKRAEEIANMFQTGELPEGIHDI